MPNLERWSKLMSLFGGVGLVAGSIDPMEGAALILPGSALLALGGYLGREDRRLVAYRTWGFILVALGVGALLGLSAMGGIGGSSGHSAWWALLILPYLIGWSIDVWGPGTPRWISLAGIVIGAWYLAILAPMLHETDNPAGSQSIVPATLLAVIGIGTIVGCTVRLRKSSPAI